MLMLGAERGFRLLVLLVGALIVASLLVGDSAVESPLESGAIALLWPAMPLVLASAIPACVVPPLPSLTRVNSRRRAFDRAIAAGVYCLLFVVLCGTLWLRIGYLQVLAVGFRSSALGLGLALCSAVWLSHRVSWLPVAMMTICTVMFGSRPGGEAANWALIYAPLNAWATVVSAAVFVAGVVGFVFLGSRSERGNQILD